MCLLNYIYFKKYCKLIVLDLRKQVNFTGNLEQDGKTQFFFFIKEPF